MPDEVIPNDVEGTNEDSSTSEDTTAKTESSSSSNRWDDLVNSGSEIPVETLEKIVRAHPKGEELVMKGVRNSTIDSRAEAKAEAKFKELEGKVGESLKALQKERDDLATQLRNTRRENMSQYEVEEEDRVEEITGLRNKATNYDLLVLAIEEEKNRAKLLDYAKDNYGLEDDDLEGLKSAPDGYRLMDSALKAAATKMAKGKKDMEDTVGKFAAELEAIKRQLSGASSFPGGEGGGGSSLVGDAIEREFYENPDNKSIREKYAKWREQSGN